MDKCCVWDVWFLCSVGGVVFHGVWGFCLEFTFPPKAGEAFDTGGLSAMLFILHPRILGTQESKSPLLITPPALSNHQAFHASTTGLFTAWKTAHLWPKMLWWIHPPGGSRIWDRSSKNTSTSGVGMCFYILLSVSVIIFLKCGGMMRVWYTVRTTVTKTLQAVWRQHSWRNGNGQCFMHPTSCIRCCFKRTTTQRIWWFRSALTVVVSRSYILCCLVASRASRSAHREINPGNKVTGL